MTFLRYHSTAENLILGRKSNPGQPQGLHYDDAYRLIGTTQGLALGTTLGEDEFVSDGTVGTPNPGNWRSGYSYDSADNLTQASSETNPAGNWIATPNALNQITSKGGNSWVYDAAGNLLDDGNRTYEWDAQQRLIAITDKATGRKSEFIYDGQSRLTVTKEYPAGSSTGQETRYLWCGHKVCQSRDGQDNVTARYFDEGEIKTSNTGTTALYYTRDHLGSIMETTQASGKVLGSLDYGPYGEPEKAQGQLPDFRYAGMLHHAPTGLYLTHYRAYDPSVGRWLNRDPIEESGGINLYGYVGGNPVSFVDPLGLDRWGDQPGFQWSVKSGVPLPKGELYVFTVCLQACYGSSLIVTSTHEPYKGHGSGTAHGDSAALDLRYSALKDPEKVLCCAAKCKARYALDESKKPSKHSSAPHFHIELPHPRNKNWSKGDLPKDGDCKKC